MRRGMMIGLVLLLLGSVAGNLVAGGGSQSGGSKTFTLHLAYSEPYDENGSHTAAAAYMKREIEKRTNGNVKIEIHPNEELGTETESVEMIKANEIALAIVASPVLSGFTDLFTFADVPMLFTSSDQLYNFTKSNLFTARLEKLSGAGFVGLGGVCGGGRYFFTAKNYPIRSVADMKGLNIRVLPTPPNLRGVQLLGGNPTTLSYSECYQSLQTGVIVGMENESATYTIMRFYEVAPNFLDVPWLQLLQITIGSPKLLGELPAEYQSIVKTVSAEAGKVGFDAVENYSKGGARVTAKAGGANYITVSDAVKKEFADALKPLQTEYANAIGQDIFNWLAANP